MPASVTSTSISPNLRMTWAPNRPNFEGGRPTRITCRAASHIIRLRCASGFEVRRNSDIDVDPVRAEDKAVEVHVPQALLRLSPA